MKKKDIILLLLFLLLIGVGLWIIREKYPKEVVKIEIRENEKKIDSLKFLIREDSLMIDSLKKVKNKIIEKTVVKKEKIKSLSPDSTIKLFYKNLQDYGEIESKEPKLMEDSSITCSVDNLRGANVIVTKYEGKVEEAEVLKNMVDLENGIIEKKDSIIKENSIILSKTKEAYDTELGDLRKELKRETMKKRIATYGGVFLAGILGAIIFIK